MVQRNKIFAFLVDLWVSAAAAQAAGQTALTRPWEAGARIESQHDGGPRAGELRVMAYSASAFPIGIEPPGWNDTFAGGWR